MNCELARDFYRRLRDAETTTTNARGKSTEDIARAAYHELPARDKMLVQSWRALGNSWFDSVVNSGVLVPSGHRVRPEEFALIAERERLDQLFVKEQEWRNLACTKQRARTESAQHDGKRPA